MKVSPCASHAASVPDSTTGIGGSSKGLGATPNFSICSPAKARACGLPDSTMGRLGANGSLAEAGAGIVISPAARASGLPDSTTSGGGGANGLGSTPVAASTAPANTTTAPTPKALPARLTAGPVRRFAGRWPRVRCWPAGTC